MGQQSLRHQTLLHFLFQGVRQLLDLVCELVEQVEQILLSSAGPRCSCDGLQFFATGSSPQRFLATQAFVECDHLQLIHDPGAVL